MPTGYTSAIADDISFEEFVWRCAAGAYDRVSLHSEPNLEYETKRFAEAQKRLSQLHGMSATEIEESAEWAYQKAYKNWESLNASDRVLHEKYETMLAKVQAWSPPTPEHEHLKAFMIEQIQSSIKFDCYEDRREVPLKTTPKDWFAAEIKNATRAIEWAAIDRQKEIEKVKERNEWLQALDRSVPLPEKLRAK